VDGRFLIDRVPVGTYTLTIRKAGHLPLITEVRVTGGEIELAPVTLEPAPP
jgi:hypothetical protein